MVATYSETVIPGQTVVSVIDPLAPDGSRVIKSVATDNPSSVELPVGPTHDGMRFKEWALVKDAAGNWIYTPVYEPVCPECPSDCRGGGSTNTVVPPIAPRAATPETSDPTSLAGAIVAAVAGSGFAAAGIRLRMRREDERMAA